MLNIYPHKFIFIYICIHIHSKNYTYENLHFFNSHFESVGGTWDYSGS